MDEIDQIVEKFKTLGGGKREDYAEWSEFFMNVAIESSKRSKDKDVRVGTCIVKDNRIISTGYNGFPVGADDDLFPWFKQHKDGKLFTKEYYVVHAEANAITGASKHGISTQGGTLYTTLYPCNHCAGLIIQSGIAKVIYLEKKEPSKKSEKYIASEVIFRALKFDIQKYTPT